MKRLFLSHIFSTGLAIFSMLFGAGNLMYPLMVGMKSGNRVGLGMASFIVTAVILPIIGLVAMVLFDGNYRYFFNRLGKRVGSALIFACIILIGPGLVIPRIITLSHTMLSPYLSFAGLQIVTPISSLIFAILFLGITFIFTYRENHIVTVLGYVISPLLLTSLTIIIVKGIFFAQHTIVNAQTSSEIIKDNMLRGYETLDLLGAIFFSSIIITILKRTLGKELEANKRMRMLVVTKAGIMGVALLGIVYVGMGYLGAFYGHGLETLNEGDLFREISTRILGTEGTLIIAIAVFMACLSTSIALGSVVAEYIQKITNNTIKFIPSLLITLAACIPLSTFGLDTVLRLTAGPIVYVGYPVLIVLTLLNILYKLFDFKPVKLPVLATLILTLLSYVW